MSEQSPVIYWRERSEAAETERDAALFDKAVAAGKVRVAEVRAEAAEKREAALREALEKIRKLSGTYVSIAIAATDYARAALESKP